MKARLLVAVAVLVVAVAAVAFYFYRMVTYKPRWYTELKAAGEPSPAAEAEAVRREIEQVEQSLKITGAARVADENAALVMMHEVKKRTQVDVTRTVKAAKLTRKPETVEMEVVVDINELPREKLPPRIGKALDKVLELAPGSALDEFYVKVEFEPSPDDSSIGLSPTSKVSVGKMRFTVEELERSTGLSSENMLRKLGWSDIRLTQDGVVVTR